MLASLSCPHYKAAGQHGKLSMVFDLVQMWRKKQTTLQLAKRDTHKLNELFNLVIFCFYGW
jgi:hypothetical protein